MRVEIVQSGCPKKQLTWADVPIGGLGKFKGINMLYVKGVDGKGPCLGIDLDEPDKYYAAKVDNASSPIEAIYEFVEIQVKKVQE